MTHSLTYLPACSLTYSLTYSLIHLFTHSLTYLFSFLGLLILALAVAQTLLVEKARILYYIVAVLAAVALVK